jgi:hypothetical protein
MSRTQPARETGKPETRMSSRPAAARTARIALFIYASLIAVPLRFHPVEPGLDPSWAFALNWFHSIGLRHGTDLGFTWGPFAFLAIAMDVGQVLAVSAAAQVAGWLVYAVTLAWVAFVWKVTVWRLAAFAAAVYAGLRFFHIFGYAGFDFFLSWLVLLLLGCTIFARRWYVPFATAVVLAALLALIKFSTGIAAASAVLAFPIGLALTDRARSLRAALLAGAGLPVVFAAGFLMHNPSLAGLVRYLRTGYELSSEHSTILSLGGDIQALYLALALLACYAVVSGVLLRRRNQAVPLAAAMAGPLFLEFKHSFIREPGHVEMLFLFAPLVAAVLLLFVSEVGRPARVLTGIAIVFAVLWIYCQPRTFRWQTISANRAGLFYARPLLEVLNWANLERRLRAQTSANLGASVLPAELLARIGERTVTIFPWESSYAAANRLNYRPFPVFQSYDAYTPFLDRWNADFLAEAATAPEYVLLDWAAIDERHPLLDVPQMALELYRNYELEAAFGPHLLLRRLAAPRFTAKPRRIAEGTLDAGQKLVLPPGTKATVVRLHLDWSFAGALRKLFWRLPEVRWIGMYADGSSVSARIPPAVPAGGVPVDVVPNSAAHLRDLYSGAAPRKLESIVIAGDGAKYLRTGLRHEILQIDDLPAAAQPLQEVFVSPGLRGDCRIDTINGAGVTGRRDVIEVAAPEGYVAIRGWAIAKETAPDIAVFVDGRPHRATYGFPRADVAAIYGSTTLANSGFELALPRVDLGRDVHEIRAAVRGASGTYQACADSVRLKLD